MRIRVQCIYAVFRIKRDGKEWGRQPSMWRKWIETDSNRLWFSFISKMSGSTFQILFVIKNIFVYRKQMQWQSTTRMNEIEQKKKIHTQCDIYVYELRNLVQISCVLVTACAYQMGLPRHTGKIYYIRF